MITTDHIQASYGSTVVVDDVTIELPSGGVTALVGPNGAGKSTTIRAILGQVRLTGGSLTVLGRDPLRDAVSVHRHLAYVPGDTVLWPTLTGGQCIDVISGLQGSRNARRRSELIERFELDPRRRARTYSKGNRQKVALIAALSTDAELLLLDEPTSGLDPVMEDRFCQTIREVAAEGRTVLLSSHILSEVDALCDAVTIIRNGQAAMSDSMAQMRSLAVRSSESEGSMWAALDEVFLSLYKDAK